MWNEFMTKPLSPQKEYYSESEAARFLNISVAHLYMLLDEFVFNDGSGHYDNAPAPPRLQTPELAARPSDPEP